MGGSIAPAAPYPVLFTDELEWQSLKRAQLGELRGIALQHDPFRRARVARIVPPAKLQVDADELDEQAATLRRWECPRPSKKVRDLARTVQLPGPFETQDSRFEIVVRHSRVARR